MAKTRYFTAQNASRSFQGISFTVYNRIAGCAYGYYATSEESELKILDDLKETPTSAVKEITEDEYQTLVKKNQSLQSNTLKPVAQSPVPPLPAVTPVEVPSPDISKSPVAVTEPAPEPAPETEPVTVDDALSTGTVEPPKKPSGRGRKVK